MKRLFDIFASAVLTALLAPLSILVAGAILLDSGRPVLFRQKRVGKGTREFEMLKFRTMIVGADQIGPYFTSFQDSRVTRVGRILRRCSVDELPQLLNVLRGDMSMIGPRPAVAIQREQYSASEWELRHSVTPGITGLAQATLRSGATMEQLKALEGQYLRERSWRMDLRILGLTIRQVLGAGGN